MSNSYSEQVTTTSDISFSGEARERIKFSLDTLWLDRRTDAKHRRQNLQEIFFSAQGENRGDPKKGQWDAPKTPAMTEEQSAFLSDLLKEYKHAYANFQAVSLSVKKTYTQAYFDVKAYAGREKRIAWMVDRLNQNLCKGCIRLIVEC